MTWFYLALAIIFEVGWAVSMKALPALTLGFPLFRTAVLYILSLVFLTLAVRKLDVGVAYAIWAGLGIGIIAIIGSWKFGEAWGTLKTAALGFILIGVIGIHLADLRRSSGGGTTPHDPQAAPASPKSTGF